MRLGTRWASGQQPPAAVPEVLHEQITAVERALPADAVGSAAPWWTLTFLEGRPVAELETGVIVKLTAAGVVTVEHDAGDEFA